MNTETQNPASTPKQQNTNHLSEWKKVKLGDVVTFQRGYDLTKNQMKNGQVPVAGSNGIIGYHNQSTTKGPGVTIGRSGNIGTAHFYKTDFWAHNTVLFVKEFNLSEPKFIYYFLKTIDFTQFNAGSSVPTLNRNHIHQLDFLLPPLPEQQAIAEVLSSLDDKIDLLHRQNKTLEALAETLFRQWFIEETDERWEDVSLGNSELSTIISSGIREFEGEKIFLATGDVQDTLITGGEKIRFNNRPSRANMQPVEYSVWFAKKGGVRKLLMFDDYSDINKHILSTGFSGLKTNELSHYYIWCYVLSKEFQEIKDSLVSGSVQPDITNEGIKSILIPKPDNQTLLKFNQLVKPWFIKIQKNNSQIRTLTALRDTLLPKLMSGEVRVDF